MIVAPGVNPDPDTVRGPPGRAFFGDALTVVGFGACVGVAVGGGVLVAVGTAVGVAVATFVGEAVATLVGDGAARVLVG